jgi:ribosome maturation factor RimP
VDTLSERVRSLAEPVLTRLGAELVDVEVKQGRTQHVRVIADKPGGIDLDTCAQVSSELGRMLDVDDPVPGRYMLEVSSPGLDRPLKTPADFRRNVGKQVKVVMAKEQFEGIIEEVREDVVVVSGRETSYEDVKRAKLVLPW